MVTPSGMAREPTLLTALSRRLTAPTEEALLAKLYHDEIDHWRLLDQVPLLFERRSRRYSSRLIVALGPRSRLPDTRPPPATRNRSR
jgi:hypothetical protein